MKRTLVTLLFGLFAVGAGCYGDDYATTPAFAAARPVTVAVAPPAPVDEVPPRQPFVGSAWMSGYWDWRGDLGRYVWVAGHWGYPPRAGLAYMPPSWQPASGGGYYRMPGHWVQGPNRDVYGRHLAYDSWGRPHYF